jgi:chromosomal replication initiation ATPase DnaA
MTTNAWDAICAQIRLRMDAEDYQRWFGATAYASDSGDQISVWVPSEAIRRHISGHFQSIIDEALATLNRADTHIRFIVGGMSDEEDDL